MSNVTIKENISKQWESSTFNFRVESNGGDVYILYKQGLIPSYQRSLSISGDDLSQLIDALTGMQKVLSESTDGKTDA